MHGLPFPLFNRQILDCLEGAMKNMQHPTTLRSHCSIGSDEPLQVIALRKYISRDSGFEVGQMAVTCPYDVDTELWCLEVVMVSNLESGGSLLLPLCSFRVVDSVSGPAGEMNSGCVQVEECMALRGMSWQIFLWMQCELERGPERLCSINEQGS